MGERDASRLVRGEGEGIMIRDLFCGWLLSCGSHASRAESVPEIAAGPMILASLVVYLGIAILTGKRLR